MSATTNYLRLVKTPSSWCALKTVRFKPCTTSVGIVVHASAKTLKGIGKTYVCPYHGWVYHIDGSLKVARETHVMRDFDQAQHGLKPVSCVTYMGLVFINCDPNAGDLSASLDQIKAQLGAYDLDHAKVAHRKTYRVDANWKLAIENYLECYHCATSHRSYARAHTLKDLEEKSAPVVAKMLERAEEITGISGISKEHTTIYLGRTEFWRLRARYAVWSLRWLCDRHARRSPCRTTYGQTFRITMEGLETFSWEPMSFMLNYPDHCVLYRFLPRSLTETDMELVWLVRDDAAEGTDYDLDRLTWLWHHTTLEDEYIITRNAAGVNSRFFEPGPYHPEFEFTLTQFYSLVFAHLRSQH